jgi:two-component system, OmpR family, sensor histidine kinase TorS
MLSRLGIGARLFLAFLGITALSLSSGIAGWLILRDISAAQSRINSQALPAVAAAQRSAETSARLVASAPALTAVRDEASRAAQERELSSLAAEIRKSVSDAGLSSLDGAVVGKLGATVDALVANLAAQNRLVKERLQLQESFAERAERTIRAATAIADLSETLVSNTSAGASAVISSLYGLIDEGQKRAEAYEALDRLIEQDIYLLGRMWELRLRSSQIGLLAHQLTRTIDRNEVAEIARGYEEHLRVVRRRVASIDDPVRREQASGFLETLDAASGNAPVSASLFGERLRLIAIADDLESVAEANSNLSAEVSRVAQGMLRSSESFARSISAQVQNALDAGLYILLATSLIAVAISGLIVWLYVERGIVRRLAALSNAMQRLTDGDLTVRVAAEGTKELKALSSAVVAFRDESQKRRALEIERERTNEELRRHREELQGLVNQRTEELQQEVARHAQARAEAEMASQAKSAFLATMSHEIRTPMTGMLGMLRILKEAELTPAQRRYVTVASNSGETLLGILNSILDYSKIESGKLTIDLVAFDLADLLRGIIDLMRPSARQKGLKLSLSVERDLAPLYMGDAGKLRQIVFNLVSNAIKFTARGRVTVKAAAMRRGKKRHALRITVEDTGIGIEPGQQSHIFESFTQTDASITRRYGGTGLGLAISRGFALAMGSTLTVDSNPRQGSVFTLDIEMPPASVKQQPRAPARSSGKSRGRHLKILVVEDDAATRLVAQEFLAKLGHEAAAVPDGHAAIAQFGELAPDLVLMDISMPDMDGIATARALRARHGMSVPFVAMSAHVFKGEVDRYLASGMDAYVAKPLTIEALAQAIASATGGRASAQPAVDRAAFEADLDLIGRQAMSRIFAIVEETLPPRFTEMHEALGAKDFDRLKNLAHKTYSTAASAGFSELCQEARALETSAGAADRAKAAVNLARCETFYQEAMARTADLILAAQDERLRAAAKR